MGTGFSKKKKQARLLQEQFSKMQEQVQNAEATGSSGNGLVTIVLTGDNFLKNITIKPECVDPEDIEGLQDLIQAAYKDAYEKLKQKTPEMPQLPGMPGLGQFGL